MGKGEHWADGDVWGSTKGTCVGPSGQQPRERHRSESGKVTLITQALRLKGKTGR